MVIILMDLQCKFGVKGQSVVQSCSPQVMQGIHTCKPHYIRSFLHFVISVSMAVTFVTTHKA